MQRFTLLARLLLYRPAVEERVRLLRELKSQNRLLRVLRSAPFAHRNDLLAVVPTRLFLFIFNYLGDY